MIYKLKSFENNNLIIKFDLKLLKYKIKSFKIKKVKFKDSKFGKFLEKAKNAGPNIADAALKVATGDYNVAVGTQALLQNTTASNINAVGVVGLVENMPGGNAQRPGDIVNSFSGKTIEVLNTDAEGRLVLADALSFTEKKFKPKFMIDLATLTGAIIVSLGSEYAGLFSNNDKLSKQLLEVGEKVEEKLWRMPLHKNFDKLLSSDAVESESSWI